MLARRELCRVACQKPREEFLRPRAFDQQPRAPGDIGDHRCRSCRKRFRGGVAVVCCQRPAVAVLPGVQPVGGGGARMEWRGADRGSFPFLPREKRIRNPRREASGAAGDRIHRFGVAAAQKQTVDRRSDALRIGRRRRLPQTAPFQPAAADPLRRCARADAAACGSSAATTRPASFADSAGHPSFGASGRFRTRTDRRCCPGGASDGSMAVGKTASISNSSGNRASRTAVSAFA